MNNEEQVKKEEEYKKYKENLTSVLNRMVKDIAIRKPSEKDVPQFMVKWFMKDGEIDGNLLNFDERSELSYLRRRVPEFRKIDEHAHFQPPPPPENPEEQKDIKPKDDKSKDKKGKDAKGKEKDKQKQPVIEEKEISDADDDDFDLTLTKDFIKADSANKPYRLTQYEEIYGQTYQKDEPVLTTKKKSSEDNNFIKTRIMLSNFFSSFETKDLDNLIEYFALKQFTGGENLINYGDPLNNFYLIKTGKVEYYKKVGDKPEELISTLVPGDSFGQFSLITPSVSDIRIKVVEDGECFMLDRDSYLIKKREFYQKRIEKNTAFIQKIPVLATLEPKEIKKLAEGVRTGTYYEEEVIYCEGESGDIVYLLESGEANITKIKEAGLSWEIVGKFKQGTIIEEKALLPGGFKRTEGLIAASPVLKVLSIDRFSLENLIGPLDELLKRNEELYNVYYPPPPKEEEKKEGDEDRKEEEVLGDENQLLSQKIGDLGTDEEKKNPEIDQFNSQKPFEQSGYAKIKRVPEGLGD